MSRVLIISFVEWHGAVQRPQHMARGLAVLGWEVTYVNPMYLHRSAPEGASGRESGGVKVIEPICLPGERRLGLVGEINNWLIERAVRSAGGGDWDAVIFNDPRRADVAASVGAKLKIYDAMDDLSALMPSDAAAKQAEAKAVGVADLIWTGTAIMADRLKGRHASVTFIPNGVDAQMFGNPIAERVENVRKELAGMYRAEDAAAPLAGFFGVLNERLDAGLVASLLDEGWRVVLIGPSTSQCPKLPEHPRLILAGWRAYEALPEWLACFDLAIIPYRVDGANRFLYPVKALEYLAGGKPVLSSALPDIERFLKDYVLIEGSVEGWRQVAREWSELKPEAQRRADLGRAFSAQRDWSAMAKELSNLLSAAR